jgi:hypothetical protein
MSILHLIGLVEGCAQPPASGTGAPDPASTGTSAVGDRRPRELLRPWPDADLLRRSAARCAAVYARFAPAPATPAANQTAAIPIPLRRQPPPAAIPPGPGGARAEFLGTRRKRRRPSGPPVEGAVAEDPAPALAPLAPPATSNRDPKPGTPFARALPERL